MAKARDGTRTHISHHPGQDIPPPPSLGAVTKLSRYNMADMWKVIFSRGQVFGG